MISCDYGATYHNRYSECFPSASMLRTY